MNLMPRIYRRNVDQQSVCRMFLYAVATPDSAAGRASSLFMEILSDSLASLRITKPLCPDPYCD